jgi:hypothetical protein
MLVQHAAHVVKHLTAQHAIMHMMREVHDQPAAMAQCGLHAPRRGCSILAFLWYCRVPMHVRPDACGWTLQAHAVSTVLQLQVVMGTGACMWRDDPECVSWLLPACSGYCVQLEVYAAAGFLFGRGAVAVAWHGDPIALQGTPM